MRHTEGLRSKKKNLVNNLLLTPNDLKKTVNTLSQHLLLYRNCNSPFPSTHSINMFDWIKRYLSDPRENPYSIAVTSQTFTRTNMKLQRILNLSILEIRSCQLLRIVILQVVGNVIISKDAIYSLIHRLMTSITHSSSLSAILLIYISQGKMHVDAIKMLRYSILNFISYD